MLSPANYHSYADLWSLSIVWRMKLYKEAPVTTNEGTLSIRRPVWLVQIVQIEQ